MTVKGFARGALTVIRWWFGLTYLVTGLVLVIVGITQIFIEPNIGNGIFAVLSGPILGTLGWLIHPWGLQRTIRKRTASASLDSGFGAQA
jgi:hypothetical protein